MKTVNETTTRNKLPCAKKLSPWSTLAMTRHKINEKRARANCRHQALARKGRNWARPQRSLLCLHHAQGGLCILVYAQPYLLAPVSSQFLHSLVAGISCQPRLRLHLPFSWGRWPAVRPKAASSLAGTVGKYGVALLRVVAFIVLFGDTLLLNLCANAKLLVLFSEIWRDDFSRC